MPVKGPYRMYLEMGPLLLEDPFQMQRASAVTGARMRSRISGRQTSTQR